MRQSAGRLEFVTLLVGGGPLGAVVMLPVPREVSQHFGTRERVAVKGTVNGRPLRALAQPDGQGGHAIALAREMPDLRGGDRVKVVLELPESEAEVEVPADLQKALGRNVQARAAWEKFAPAQRRAWVGYLAQEKKQEHRAKRIGEVISRIALGKAP